MTDQEELQMEDLKARIVLAEQRVTQLLCLVSKLVAQADVDIEALQLNPAQGPPRTPATDE